ncbi:MAG TPA: 2-amino-4-hydroxy-6-hydroxymethyldihydropteridine diphosphokinase [Planctomycetota bacterium]|nr:2-amino-4-hydroxy-6-hydroxymethyldihydropteridine diphosphokinase [Planctomycetota bacterium]
MPVTAYIGLGSNLGDRRAALDGALALLEPLRVSRIVETAPWGKTDQPPFLNAVAEIRTDLEPRPLLDRLLDLERRFGRRRDVRWGPRTLDLDLLLYGDRRVSEEGLDVPHPRLAERRFVLEGLAELCPDRPVPGLDRTVRQLLEACP